MLSVPIFIFALGYGGWLGRDKERETGDMGLRCLVVGKTGQVAVELARRAPAFGLEFVFAGRDLADLAHPEQASTLVARLRPALVINAAAYTKVDLAESEPDLAMAVNAASPAAMAVACAEVGASLIHLSTDYVFGGSKAGAWTEDDPVNPMGAYAASKEAGEQAVRETLDSHIILRTAWVFSAIGQNFVKTMLRLGAERPELRIVDDQRGGPTWAGDIAEAVLSMAADILAGCRQSWGTFHYCGTPETTWFRFAQAIFQQAGTGPNLVPIATGDYPTPARRPENSVLDCRKLAGCWGISQPDWRDGLARVIAELRGV